MSALLRNSSGSCAAAWTAGECELASYGTVVGAMAAASLHGSLGEVIVTVLVTVAVYWAAERYAEVLASAVHGPGRRSRVAQALRRGWPTIEATYTHWSCSSSSPVSSTAAPLAPS